MTPPKANQACRACRRLKRKCTKELPSCSLCIRLGKTCEYPNLMTPDSTISPNLVNRLRHLEQLLDVSSSSQIESETPAANLFTPVPGPSQPFPLSFFLDVDFFTPLNTNALACSRQPSMQQIVSDHLEPDRIALCERFFSTIHAWLPMISRKRLMNEFNDDPAETDSCHALLLLCMKLCATNPENRPMESPLYTLARSLCSAAESGGFVSVRLVQSLVLVTVYELSHAIYPAAYLTIGRAARLGVLLGLYDKKNAQQLFKSAETWTLREEQRRTWWAIFVLDRFINAETGGLPFAAPEPCTDELLPVNDEDWDKGRIVASESLYTVSFSRVTIVGSFARTCQAAHMLSKVISHRETKRSSQDVANLLQEAQRLHCALCALHLSIEGSELAGNPPQALGTSILAALAICTSARFLLYNQYGCNELSGTTAREAIALETEMQNVSLEGIKTLTSSTVPRIARTKSECPLVAQCLYYAATECAWFLREDHEPPMYKALGDIVRGLEFLGEQWVLGVEYVNLLKKGGILKLIDTEVGAISSP